MKHSVQSCFRPLYGVPNFYGTKLDVTKEELEKVFIPSTGFLISTETNQTEET